MSKLVTTRHTHIGRLVESGRDSHSTQEMIRILEIKANEFIHIYTNHRIWVWLRQFVVSSSLDHDDDDDAMMRSSNKRRMNNNIIRLRL